MNVESYSDVNSDNVIATVCLLYITGTQLYSVGIVVLVVSVVCALNG